MLINLTCSVDSTETSMYPPGIHPHNTRIYEKMGMKYPTNQKEIFLFSYKVHDLYDKEDEIMEDAAFAAKKMTSYTDSL